MIRIITRLTGAMLIAGLSLAAAGQVGRVSAAATVKSPYAALAGKWGVDVIFACNGAVTGKNACHVPEVDMTLVTVTARANGTFSFVETDVQQASNPHAPYTCGLKLLSNGNVPFNNQCVYGSVGTGYFAVSKKSHVIGFWLKTQTYHFPNGASYHNPSQAGPFPNDTGIPAKPAVYNTAAAARLFGFGQAPSALTVRIVVTHTA